MVYLFHVALFPVACAVMSDVRTSERYSTVTDFARFLG